MSHTAVLAAVMAVPLIIWFGIFSYLLLIDRQLRSLENSQNNQDDL